MMNELLLRRRVASAKSLPYDSEIEYLESSGTQRIDTGVSYDSSVMADTNLMVLSSTPNGRVLFGIYWDGGSGARRWTLQAITRGQGGYISVGTIQSGFTLSKSVWHEIVFDYHSVSVDGTVTQESASSFTPTVDVDISIFARHIVYNADTYDNYINMRVKSFKLNKGGVLVRDYIPVRVGTTGYLYDKVSKQLFGNAGTGDFILGPDK